MSPMIQSGGYYRIVVRQSLICKLGLNDGWQLSLMFYHMIPSISIFLSNLVATHYLSFQYLIPTTVIDGKAYHSHSKSLSQVDCFLNELSDYQIDIQNGIIPRLLLNLEKQ